MPAVADLVAKYFRGLGEPTRLRILELLRDEGELWVGELGQRLGVPQPKVSEPSRLSALVRLHRGAAGASGRLQSDRRQAGAEDARARARATRGQRGTHRCLLPDRGDAVS